MYAKDSYGYIDVSGNYIINPFYEDAKPFTEGLAAVKKGDKWGFVNKKGKMVIKPAYEDVNKFSGGYAMVEKNGMYGFINKKGKLVVDYSYIYSTGYTTDGYAIVTTKDKKYTLLDKDGKEFKQKFEGILDVDYKFCKQDKCKNMSGDSDYCNIH